MRKKFGAFIAVAGLVAVIGLAPLRIHAQPIPGPHPAYLHALDDLRAARAFLSDRWQWEPVRRDDEAAIREIDAAIHEIKKAAIDDGKDINDRPPIDVRLSPHDRFRKANELLFAAHQDLAHPEDVPEARGLRDRAIGHVDAAHSIVDNAERTAHWQ
jgi:hypothetical protein